MSDNGADDQDLVRRWREHKETGKTGEDEERRPP
jgi:hypothetical protein